MHGSRVILLIVLIFTSYITALPAKEAVAQLVSLRARDDVTSDIRHGQRSAEDAAIYERSPEPKCLCITEDGPCKCGAVKRSAEPQRECSCLLNGKYKPCACSVEKKRDDFESVNEKRSPVPEPRCLCIIDDKPCHCGGPIINSPSAVKRAPAPEPEPRCLCIIDGKPCQCGGLISPPSKRSPDPRCQCFTIDGPCHCGTVKRSPEPEPNCLCIVDGKPCHCGGAKRRDEIE